MRDKEKIELIKFLQVLNKIPDKNVRNIIAWFMLETLKYERKNLNE